jgi:UDP-2,3-diacylglucosamine pyrophosphatase LpxH
MLVIISDTHLSDGTTSTNPSPQAFEILRNEIEENAVANEAQEIRLVLLGDIFDLVRTDWWFDPANVSPSQRPWNGELDPRTAMNRDTAAVERQFGAVLGRILEHPAARAFIEMINTLPSTKARQRPALSYVIGNHDRAFTNFPSLRQMVRERFAGLQLDFVNAFTDPAYGVAARHGHEWEENCNARLLLRHVLHLGQEFDFLDPAINQVMSIGEVITAELMSGLVGRIKASGDASLAELIQGVDNLRPATDVFQWVQWQARGRNLSAKEQDVLARHLIDSISGVVESEFGKLWDEAWPDLLVSGDLVDRLQLIRDHLQADGLDALRFGADLLAKRTRWKDTLAPEPDDCFEGARKEFARLDPEVQFLVYGHTHRARHDYLSGQVDGRVRLYVNTGTYLPLIERTADATGFATSHQMTMAFFYKDGEDLKGRARGGPTVDLWNGIKRKEYV